MIGLSLSSNLRSTVPLAWRGYALTGAHGFVAYTELSQLIRDNVAKPTAMLVGSIMSLLLLGVFGFSLGRNLYLANRR